MLTPGTLPGIGCGSTRTHPRRSVGEAESGIEYRNYAVCIVQDTGRATAPLRLIFLKPVSTSPSSDLSAHFSSSSVPTIARSGLQASARATCPGDFVLMLFPCFWDARAAIQPGARCWGWGLDNLHRVRLDSAFVLQAVFGLLLFLQITITLLDGGLFRVKTTPGFEYRPRWLSLCVTICVVGTPGTPLRLLQAVILGRDRDGDRDHPPHTAPVFSPPFIPRLRSPKPV